MSACWTPRTHTPVEGHPGDAARRWMDSPSPVQPRRWTDFPSPVQPKWQVTFEDTSLDSSPETTLKSVDWSKQVEDNSPSPSGGSDETSETVDLTQPVEGDDCFSLSNNSDETVDWFRPARGDPPVLDLHVQEFVSGTESPGSRGDEPDQSVMQCDVRFSAQDYRLKQSKRTLVYTKALQHWAEVAKPLQPGQPCQLAECVKELRRCMRLFTMFSEEQVLSKDPPSPGVMITPS